MPCGNVRQETQRALVRRGLVGAYEGIWAYGRLNADGKAVQKVLNMLERDLETGALIFEDPQGR